MNPVLEIGWNLLLAAAEIGVALAMRSLGAPPRRVVSWVAFTLILGAAIAFPLTGDAFATLRLWSWAIFAHAPVLLLAGGWALRKRSRRAAAACGLSAAALLAVAADAFLIEPRRLDVTHVRVVSAKAGKPFRIAVLSDIQTDHVGEHERRAVRAAMAEKPDLVLLTGDYIEEEDDAKRRTQHESLRALFREESLAAPMGVFAVMGDNDSGDWLDIFTGLPMLASGQTFHAERDGVALVGLSLHESRRPGLRIPQTPGFQVVFGHAPDFSLGDVQADLLVAGHTHGGQVQIPGFGPLITLTRIPRGQAAGGAHDLGGGRTLVVSRGIGMERGSAPRLRFFCAPQVVIVDVEPAR